jgi:membrane fusion protein, heavy metal efflux system
MTIRTLRWWDLVLLAVAPMTLGCGQSSEPAGQHADPHGHEEHDEAPVAKGPHRGRLLVGDELTVELTIYEQGVPPQFRLFATNQGRPVPPKDLAATVALTRLGGRVDTIRFTPEADYLRGDRPVEEPHSFDVAVTAEWRGKTFQWHYEQAEGRVTIPDDALAAAGIQLAVAGPGPIAARFEFPGTVQVNQDRLAHVVPRLAGVVAEAPVTLGQLVRAGQRVAAIDSRELADLKSDFIEAVHELELAQAIFTREERLWKRRITAEVDYLVARHKLEEAELKAQIAEQKLLALGIPRATLSALSVEPQGTVRERKVRTPFGAQALTRFDVRSPIAGTVIEKHLAVGESVAADADILTVADLSTVWVDTAVPAQDLPSVAAGREATVRAAALGLEAVGRISYVGPVVGEDTRRASARIEISNPDGRWRPGLFVAVEIAATTDVAPVTVVPEALQSLRDGTVVFVRYGDVFEARPVEIGRRSAAAVEITSGVTAGEHYAARGSFVLKADVGKSGASHDH